MTDETWLERYRKDARFWFRVDSLLRRLEEEGGLTSKVRRQMDEIIDSDSCAAPEDMSPLEYLEGIMGELDKVDL